MVLTHYKEYFNRKTIPKGMECLEQEYDYHDIIKFAESYHKERLKNLQEEFESELDIQAIKKSLNIKDKHIAEMFEYKTAHSYYEASRRNNIENGIVKLYRKILENVLK